MKHRAIWTDDCQEKKDFDADLVSLSTRYWPGNSHYGFNPSATASIIVRLKDTADDLTIIEKDFEAATEDGVKRQVEAWAQEQFDKVVHVLAKAFNVDISSEELNA